MKEVDVSIVGQTTCEADLKRTRLGQSFDLNQNSFLCAGGETCVSSRVMVVHHWYVNLAMISGKL